MKYYLLSLLLLIRIATLDAQVLRGPLYANEFYSEPFIVGSDESGTIALHVAKKIDDERIFLEKYNKQLNREITNVTASKVGSYLNHTYINNRILIYTMLKEKKIYSLYIQEFSSLTLQPLSSPKVLISSNGGYTVSSSNNKKLAVIEYFDQASQNRKFLIVDGEGNKINHLSWNASFQKSAYEVMRPTITDNGDVTSHAIEYFDENMERVKGGKPNCAHYIFHFNTEAKEMTQYKIGIGTDVIDGVSVIKKQNGQLIGVATLLDISQKNLKAIISFELTTNKSIVLSRTEIQQQDNITESHFDRLDLLLDNNNVYGVSQSLGSKQKSILTLMLNESGKIEWQKLLRGPQYIGESDLPDNDANAFSYTPYISNNSLNILYNVNPNTENSFQSAFMFNQSNLMLYSYDSKGILKEKVVTPNQDLCVPYHRSGYFTADGRFVCIGYWKIKDYRLMEIKL